MSSSAPRCSSANRLCGASPFDRLKEERRIVRESIETAQTAFQFGGRLMMPRAVDRSDEIVQVPRAPRVSRVQRSRSMISTRVHHRGVVPACV